MIGPKPPLKPKRIWAIRRQRKTAGRTRDLALFNCAIDAKLRGCDLVKLKAGDIAPGGALRDRATAIQQKTGRPVPFEITEPTREALISWLKLLGQRTDDWLFPSRSRAGDHVSTRQSGRLVDQWVGVVGLEPRAYGTRSLRRRRPGALTQAFRIVATGRRRRDPDVQKGRSGWKPVFAPGGSGSNLPLG